MKITKKLIAAIFLILSSAETQAELLWNWYFSGITARSPNAELIIRKGLASVVLDSKIVHIKFYETDLPELKAEYVGVIKNNKEISGSLNYFFFDGAESWNGAFNKKEAPKGCEWEEILLRSSVPDGSVLMLSRQKGCTVVNDES